MPSFNLASNPADHTRTHIELLHRDNKGKVALVTMGDTFNQRFYVPKTIIKNLEKYTGQESIYISQNTFFKNSRKIEDIKYLCALYSDIDCYKAGYTKEQVIWQLEKDYYNQKIPIPSLSIDSGKGLYLIWLIRPVPPKALPLWKFTQDYIHNTLQDFGADAASRDAARFLRLAGTINEKSGSMVKILDTCDYIYTVNEIQSEFLPQKTFKNKSKSNKSPNPVTLKNIYNLHYLRFMDLKTLVRLRNGEMPDMREISCFLYRYWQCCFISDPEQALQETLDFNSILKYPLKEKEVIKATKSAEKAYRAWAEGKGNGLYKRGGYNYKNDKLIDLLQITLDEENQLETIISRGEKYRRNNKRRRQDRRNEEGLTSRETQKIKNMEKIKELVKKHPFIKQSEIAEKLGLAKSTINEYMKEVENGIISKKFGEMAL